MDNRVLSSIAAIITITNFTIAILYSFDNFNIINVGGVIRSLNTDSLFLRVIIFIVLEFIISLTFVKLISLTLELDEDIWVGFFIVLILLFSAWTTIFNVKVLFLERQKIFSPFWWSLAILYLIIANFIFATLAGNLIDEEDGFWGHFAVHLISIIVTFFILFLGNEL